ncbi:MAG: conjugal transfer protein TraI [Paracoccus denitrificans]|uniref:Conjugal transfer protein TraI n=1 Tax=Paracoccus denitrificans TaxID=266 RepID=A0A533I0T8_PARDE|nr:MAG: conjugal transfer protein TraI [Paracoccus denitrificans]
MIAKHVPMKVTRKSDFGGLVRYITSAQGRDERVGSITVTNCGSDDPFDAADDVMLVQQANTRSNADKTYHLIVSFRPGETPSPEALREIEARICAGLGYGEHQRISAAHHDTDNLHLHIAINKVHPERHTVHSPLRDYRTLAELCDKLETEFGLERDNHAARKRAGQGRAADMEQIGGLESLIGWVQRTCADEIKAADSWQALHATMAANGLSMQARGNGLVVTADNGPSIKASSIARDLSKKALEDRLGPFVAADGTRAQPTAKRAYEPRPMASRVNTAELFARYQEQQRNRSAARSAELAAAAAKRAAGIEAVKRAARLRRAAIRLAGGTGLMRRMSYTFTSRASQQAIDKITEAYRRERERINARNSRKGWHDWLQTEAKAGNVEALAAMRAREGQKHKPGNAVQASPAASHAISDAERADHVTKRGTIIYRTPGAAVRDDGNSLHVSRGAEVEGIAAALRIAQSLYGKELTIAGSAEFKERVAQAAARASLPITFDDPALERRRQALVSITQQEAARGREDIGRGDRGSDGTRGRERNAGAPGDPARAATGPTGARGTNDGTGQPGIARGDTRSAGIGGGDGPARPRRAGGARGLTGGKPNIGRVGRNPPPEARDRVRSVSELGVVRYAERPSMLLPRDVRPNVDGAEARRDRLLRWDVSGSGVTPERINAAEKYIAEREAKRQAGMDIPKHRPFEAGDVPLSYAGTREVEGQKMALLKRGDEIMVLPIDATSAARAARLAIGDKIEIAADGAVKGRGRSR